MKTKAKERFIGALVWIGIFMLFITTEEGNPSIFTFMGLGLLLIGALVSQTKTTTQEIYQGKP